MKKATIIAKGEVQRVGYREAVAKLARKIQVSGFVENLKPYDVRIVAEGDDTAIDTFIERIKIKKFPIDVEGLEVTFEEYKGEFEYFEIKTGEWQQELLERFDTAGTLLYKSMALGEESVSIGKKMLEKQDETIEAIDRSKEEIVTEISSLRGDLKSYMENKFAKIEHEIVEIKAKIGMA